MAVDPITLLLVDHWYAILGPAEDAAALNVVVVTAQVSCEGAPAFAKGPLLTMVTMAELF